MKPEPPKPCPTCGLDMNFVGRAHRCIPRSDVANTVRAIADVANIEDAADADVG
jgi:hypothetical protein